MIVPTKLPLLSMTLCLSTKTRLLCDHPYRWPQDVQPFLVLPFPVLELNKYLSSLSNPFMIEWFKWKTINTTGCLPALIYVVPKGRQTDQNKETKNIDSGIPMFDLGWLSWNREQNPFVSWSNIVSWGQYCIGFETSSVWISYLYRTWNCLLSVKYFLRIQVKYSEEKCRFLRGIKTIWFEQRNSSCDEGEKRREKRRRKGKSPKETLWFKDEWKWSTQILLLFLIKRGSLSSFSWFIPSSQGSWTGKRVEISTCHERREYSFIWRERKRKLHIKAFYSVLLLWKKLFSLFVSFMISTLDLKSPFISLQMKRIKFLVLNFSSFINITVGDIMFMYSHVMRGTKK